MFKPSHPGDLIRETIEGLREETGQDLPLKAVAKMLGTTHHSLAAILDRRQSLTPELAWRLAAAFPHTTAEFWLTTQQRYNLALAR